MREWTDDSDRVLLAVRLGWLTVEVFARLRHYIQSIHRSGVYAGNVSKRFDFSSGVIELL